MYSYLYKKLTHVYMHKHTGIYLLIHRNIPTYMYVWAYKYGHICIYRYIYVHKHKDIAWYLKNTWQFRKRGKEAIFPVLFL